MYKFTQNDGSDQIDDFQTREKFICSLCGFEFSEEKYLRNHIKHCQDIENPADRLGAGISFLHSLVPVKKEDCPKELKQCQSHVKESFGVKVEDMIFTEYTVSGSNCEVPDPQLEELCEYSDCGYKAQCTPLEEHKKIHSGGNPYVCSECDFVTTKPEYLKAHIRRHVMKNQHKSNSRDVSNKNLVSRKTYRIKITEKKRKCSSCDYACASPYNLKIHMTKHTGEKLFKCTVCEYACAQSAHLTTHMRTHTGEKPFKCTRCDYASAISANLRMHMITHTGEKSFKCTICDYAGAKRSNLISHLKIHTGEKLFKCTWCDYACATNGNLRRHMTTHTGDKPVKCTRCDYACTDNAMLTIHMRIHTGERPFKCTICDYAFARKSDLTQHIKTHTGEKPFRCTRCDYACAQSSALRRHMRKHTGEKPFKCTICDYAFTRKPCLTSHMRKHTQEINH